MPELVTSIKPKNIINLGEAASFLGISTATVKNWVKCGHLKTYTNTNEYFFNLSEIKNAKDNIINGNLDKLNKRANKSKTERTFMPNEYLQKRVNIHDLTQIINFVLENNINISLTLLLLSLNLLQKEEIISDATIKDLVNKNIIFINKQIESEIKSWISDFKIINIKSKYSFLLDCAIPRQRDSLGFIYQSLLAEGEKSQNGSYYTPEAIVDEIVKNYAKKDSKVFDPCCGTGQFLLAFAETVKDPKNIYGVDIDKTAVRIARLNILIKYKNNNFTPNIFCHNALFEIGNNDLFNLDNKNINNFDIIATNPPWGAHFSIANKNRLKLFFPEITSFESFSYFLKKSLDLLRARGIISFILPESILSVKTHKDIRSVILKNTSIKKVSYLNRVFKNVFTPVIRLDLEKSKKENEQIKIQKNRETYTAKQSKWNNNNNFIFDIHANSFDADIINKIYSFRHTTLLGQADWALGIVTGDNKSYILDKEEKGFEEIYKGKDIKKFILNKPSSYIRFTPEKFQQVAPIEKYRTKEKLIYRFISKQMVFAYDNKQRLTLNSANILIPRVPNYPIKVIAALLNSSIYQFIFQKKFSSIKILRNHIEQMPLPLWDEKKFEIITKLVEGIIANKNKLETLDDYIATQLSLAMEELDYIKKSIK